MELVDQHTKRIMEGCKERARKAGLCFENETLEYIVTNRDMLELSPKMMIPTLYDYWVHEVEVLKERGRYELYPSNPYETVINTRPAISFYNDNNPDWLNVMIFYHVLAHIDFFQNNSYFRNTWDYDFSGRALSDKRLIAKLRSEKGRWVDYVIEFTRGVDNLVGFYSDISLNRLRSEGCAPNAVDFYFDVFLQDRKKVRTSDYMKEIDRYNECQDSFGDGAEEAFFSEVDKRHPEFRTVFEKSRGDKTGNPGDLIQFILENSTFLNRNENVWMKSVVQVVRDTSLFFQPQLRTKIMNEGWASYWHETLFLEDDRINGREIEFARVHAGVTAMPRVGLNPYALGKRLFHYIEELCDKGKYTMAFRALRDVEEREEFDKGTGKGREFLFEVRENLCDYIFISAFLDQDFVNLHKLFVAGKRLNEDRMVWEYFVKSRKAEDYLRMVEDSLYHPPYIEIDREASGDNMLRLVHRLEGKSLVMDFIANTMMGIEYLWGGPVQLETSEVASTSSGGPPVSPLISEEESGQAQIEWQRVLYTMRDRKLSKKNI